MDNESGAQDFTPKSAGYSDNASPRPYQDGASPDVPERDRYVDLDDALARVRGNRKIYKTLLQSFVNNSRLDVLKDAIGKNDLDAAAKTAHAIKGSSGNLSLKGLNDAVARLEVELKSGSYRQDTLQACYENYEKTKMVIEELMVKL